MTATAAPKSTTPKNPNVIAARENGRMSSTTTDALRSTMQRTAARGYVTVILLMEPGLSRLAVKERPPVGHANVFREGPRIGMDELPAVGARLPFAHRDVGAPESRHVRFRFPVQTTGMPVSVTSATSRTPRASPPPGSDFGRATGIAPRPPRTTRTRGRP